MGKGSRQRPSDRDKFSAGWDRIFKDKKDKRVDKAREVKKEKEADSAD